VNEHPTVLNTLESIEHVERSYEKTGNTSSDFFPSWAQTSASTSTSDDDNDMGPSVKKLVTMVSSFTWNRSKRLYEKVEELSREQVACGATNDVADDNSDGILSVPLTEVSSTLSYRQKRTQGYEF
jgi:hypothetical protein